VLAAGLLVGAIVVACAPSAARVASTTAPSPGASPDLASPSGSPAPAPSPTPTPVATPTPIPSPVLVPAPLTGRLVTPAEAARHPIAVMIDDLAPARPQSGLADASIVFQAPAEGGIPRYMAIFAERQPGPVGPVRSARYYYIAWAAQWHAGYAHSGGSPQALETLAAQGDGRLVYDLDEFRWGAFFHRIPARPGPHDLYTDGSHLRKLADLVGAAAPPAPGWGFGPALADAERPVGGSIALAYPANQIRYDYDRRTNTYLRSVSVEGAERDAANGARIAPTNVVVIFMKFGPLDDGHPLKLRLEAEVIGTGPAYVATNGSTVAATWRKTALDAPLELLDRAGAPITLTVGQTFVQVLPTGTPVTLVAGRAPSTIAPWRRPR
jgi:hypothetical protein